MEHLGGPEPADKLDERQARYLEPASQMFTIRVGGERAGSVGFWDREWRGEDVYEVGWLVLPAYQGRGIATRATELVLDRVRADGRHRAVHAYPSVENPPSNAICRRLGFTLLGPEDFEYPARLLAALQRLAARAGLDLRGGRSRCSVHVSPPPCPAAMLAELDTHIENAVTEAGYAGIAAVMAIETVFPPIPSELVLPLAGFQVANGTLGYLPALGAVTLGAVLGALLLYVLARVGGRPLVMRLHPLLRISEPTSTAPTTGSTAAPCRSSASAGSCPASAASSRCPPGWPRCRSGAFSPRPPPGRCVERAAARRGRPARRALPPDRGDRRPDRDGRARRGRARLRRRPRLAASAAPTMCSGRTGMRGSGRPVAARTAATTAGGVEMFGGSPTPFSPYGASGSACSSTLDRARAACRASSGSGSR